MIAYYGKNKYSESNTIIKKTIIASNCIFLNQQTQQTQKHVSKKKPVEILFYFENKKSLISDFFLLGCLLLLFDVEVVDSRDVHFTGSNLVFQEI